MALVVTVVVVRLVGRVDWGEVRDALAHLDWWQAPVLVVLLLVRQVLNALPLALYIPGVSAVRATQNDQVAILMSTVAPPPSDLALRMAMFSSWGVPVPKGMAGTVMNTLTFYIVRFGAPAAGFVLLAATGGEVGYRWADLVSILVSVAILVGVLLVVRSDALARRVGVAAGRAATRVRRTVDPEAWAAACVRFRGDVAARFRHGFPRSLLALCGMLAVDLTMLVLALRFVGVSTSEAALSTIAVAYLFAYPFTLFPFSGLGIVDALVLAAVVDVGGAEVEAAAVAGLLVWRVFTIGGPLALGAVSLALWRRRPVTS
ncbi:lysylphosphatidylglycerol synthase domain-containing protein [Nocardioides mangrovi]|uniref:Lysylphosphatidylglycerol synthase domain-containing protein n=1 Tax=Nocardioides mangrovi TaxID=2874580 RepID=A0ABS7UIW9_9ACTN|nr:lysylphosphatidylglycerol synthase domain-containing protein [Nocardioides mangrovi]MBZ5740717.1 lysylphosphatidylglycerol synthase domain-containing protein [Nocardioides mangrovi]